MSTSHSPGFWCLELGTYLRLLQFESNTTHVIFCNIEMNVPCFIIYTHDKVNMRLSEVVFEITPVHLQLHACEPYKINHNVQHADNLELIYLSSTNT